MGMNPQPTLRVVLVRHGQSANNVLLDQSFASFTAARTPDAPLTTEGVAQAYLAGEFLASAQPQMPIPLTALYSSGMDRALHTASVIGERTGLRPTVWPDCHEVGGCFSNVLDPSTGELLGYRGVPGMGRRAIRERYPDALLPAQASGANDATVVGGALTDDGWWHGAQRETEAQAVRRVHRVISALRRRAGALGAASAVALAGEVSPRATASVVVPDLAVAQQGLSRALASSFQRSDALLAAQAAAALRGPDLAGPRLSVEVSSEPSDPDIATRSKASARVAALNARWGCTSSDMAAATPAHCEAIAIVCHGDMIDTLLRLAVGALAVDEATGAVHDRLHRIGPSTGCDNDDDVDDSPREPLQEDVYGAGFDAPAALPSSPSQRQRKDAAAAVFAAAAGHTTSPLRFVTHNCGLVWLDFSPEGHVKVVRTNDVRHLAGMPSQSRLPDGLPSPKPISTHVDGEYVCDGDDADAAVRVFIASAAAAYGHPWAGEERAAERAAFAQSAQLQLPPQPRLVSPLLTAGAASLV